MSIIVYVQDISGTIRTFRYSLAIVFEKLYGLTHSSNEVFVWSLSTKLFFFSFFFSFSNCLSSIGLLIHTFYHEKTWFVNKHLTTLQENDECMILCLYDSSNFKKCSSICTLITPISYLTDWYPLKLVSVSTVISSYKQNITVYWREELNFSSKYFHCFACKGT